MTAVSLYTSRIVLLALGLSDFGIYNVVGGVVAMFSFISASIQTATQRFMAFELGRKDEKGFNSVFCSRISTHLEMVIEWNVKGHRDENLPTINTNLIITSL